MRGRENKKEARFAMVVVAVFFVAVFLSAPETRAEGRVFRESFSKKNSLAESGSMEKSSNSDWWLNSGGIMYVQKGVGQTIQKNLSKNSKWRKLYKKTNSKDTDRGKHPQNIFRLVTRSKWQNFSQEAQFKIKRFNLSKSGNRNESNGLLLFNRYEDADNLYYAGVRVDGAAVIKKKINGEYYTLDYTKYFSRKKYDRKSQSHLLPKNKWIGLKTEVRNTDGGNVEIKLFVKQKKNWVLAAEALDEPGEYGENVLGGEGCAGIRTDFMDVEFDKYRVAEL
ncbi:MAG: hypothetical protein QMD77_04605 [Patescibacteria group bacterium]|nr:hypothetical protein [Patescibacteria group bacterium]